MISCGMDDLRFNSGQGQGIFHFSKMPRLCLGPTYSSQWVPGCFLEGGGIIMWLKCGFDHLLPFSAEVAKLIQVDPPSADSVSVIYQGPKKL